MNKFRLLFVCFGLFFLLILVGSDGVLGNSLILSRYLPGDLVPGITANNQDNPAVARGDDKVLVVWSDNRANTTANYEGESSRDIYGLILDENGNPLNSLPFVISSAPATQNYPKVAWNGSNWLVMFQTFVSTGYYYQESLAFVRVDPTGQVLDPMPIVLHGATPAGGLWVLSALGGNWVVAYEGTPASGDIMASRISPDGIVIDPPILSMVPETYFLRFNLHLACATGICLLTYIDRDAGGNDVAGAVRFDANMNILGGGPFILDNEPLAALESNGILFYTLRYRQMPDFTVAIIGNRVNINGQKLDGDGVNISGVNEPQAYAITDVAWDDTNWKVTWGFNNQLRLARINASGQLLDPGGLVVSGPKTGKTASTSSGGLQLVWTEYLNANNDIYTSHVDVANTAGTNLPVSLGAPMQLGTDVATNGSGYMVVFRSSTGSQHRVMAQPLDANGDPLLQEPILLDYGDLLTGPREPSVAWNGTLYMVSWSNNQGVVALRLQPDGTKIDNNPFLVMTPGFGPIGIAAVGDHFLIAGRRYGINPQYINTIAARVRGSDGVVLDNPPLALGGNYTRSPQVVNLAGRWLVAWHSNYTHDDPIALTQAAFVNPDGSTMTADTVFGPFSTAGGNGIFQLGLAAGDTAALMVQSVEYTSGVETDLVGRLINADGTLQPVFNMTPWRGNQYNPVVAWDGAKYVVVFQDQRNRTAELDTLDARSDLFGMRIEPTGTILDPLGFLFSNSPDGEMDPSVAADNGLSFLASSLVLNQEPYVNYRIAYEQRGLLSNDWPVAVAAADVGGGDVPLSVNFSSDGSNDPDGTIVAYHWDFGDGTTASIPNPSHTYTVGAPFVAVLTVTDNIGAESSNTVLVNAVWPNELPVAVASADVTIGPAPLNVIFRSVGSYDPDGVIVNFEWMFSTGSIYYGPTAYETFSNPGVYTATLTVTDSRGATSQSDVIQITVTGPNQLPQAVITADPNSGTAPLLVSFTGSGSFDPDGSIISFEWDFGDGSSSDEADPGHVYTAPGEYTVSLTVTDNLGGTDNALVEILVDPAPALSNFVYMPITISN